MVISLYCVSDAASLSVASSAHRTTTRGVVCPSSCPEARRLFGLAAAQGGEQGACAQALLDILARDAELDKKQADADAMMAQLLAEDDEEKKAKIAKSNKSKRTKKKWGKPPAASTCVSTDGVEARDAGLEVTADDSGEAQPAVDLAPAAHPAVSEPDVPVVDGAQAAASPVPAAIGRASGRGRGGRGLGGGDWRQVQGAAATATGLDAVSAMAPLLDQASLQVPSDDVAVPATAAAVPAALDMPPPPPAADVGAMGGRGRGRAPSSRGRGGRGLGGRGLGGRGVVVAGAVAHQTEPGQASLQQAAAKEPAAREALQSVRIGDAPSAAPAASRSLGSAAPAAASEPVAAFRSLADVGDLTGRHAVPESTIGGETTCIVCFANPKTHLAAPCGHQCACGPCSQLMQACPYCRAPVQLWVQQRMV